jgi:outer membrane protein assembly factor BamB
MEQLMTHQPAGVSAAPWSRYLKLRLVTTTFLLGGVFALSGCIPLTAPLGDGSAVSPTPVLPLDDLSIYRGNLQRTGVYPQGGSPSLTQQLWTYTAEYIIETAPVVGNGVAAFMVTNYGLYVLDASTGKLRWNTNGYKYPPTLADGLIYHEGNTGLAVQDSKSGQDKWVFGLETAGDVTSSPAIDQGVIYFGTSQGYFYALDLATRQPKWKTYIENHLSTDPAIADGLVYFAGDQYLNNPGTDVIYSERSIYALDQQTGKQIWQFSPPSSVETGGWVSDPIVADGVVYCASSEDAYIGHGYVYALDSKTGKQLWAYTPNQVLSFPKPLAASDGLVYVVGRDGPLYALDAKTGAERWRFVIGASQTAPSLAGGVLYVGSGDTLYALDAKTGKILHKIEVGISIYESPVIADGIVYVVGGDGNLGSTISAIR